MTTPSGIVVVSPRFRPLFPALHLATFEEIERLLNDIPVAELWLDQDPASAHGPDTLVSLLVGESPWEGRSQIGKIVIFFPIGEIAATEPLFAALSPHYQVELQVMKTQYFQSIAN